MPLPPLAPIVSVFTYAPVSLKVPDPVSAEGQGGIRSDIHRTEVHRVAGHWTRERSALPVAARSPVLSTTGVAGSFTAEAWRTPCVALRVLAQPRAWHAADCVRYTFRRLSQRRSQFGYLLYRAAQMISLLQLPEKDDEGERWSDGQINMATRAGCHADTGRA